MTAGDAERPTFVETEVDGATVLAVTGILDMVAAPLLADEVGRVLRRRPPILVVDLSAVTFLTTASIGVLIRAHYRCSELSSVFRIVADAATTARPLQLLGLDELLDIHPTVGAALSR